MARYERDAAGNDRYVWGRRGKEQSERAITLVCPSCEGSYLTRKSDPMRHCSGKCAQWVPPPEEMAAAKPPKDVRAARFYLDERGWWWYVTGRKNVRSRCKVKACSYCHENFIVSPYHFQIARYCSRSCSAKDQPRARGERSQLWKGGRRRMRGYIHVWNPEAAAAAGKKGLYIQEHRLVMSQVLGRPLRPEEQVHHKNGVRDDNRPENLELWVTGHSGPGQRASEWAHCPTCTCNGHA